MTPYKRFILRDPKPATHNLPHSSAGVARKPDNLGNPRSNPTPRGEWGSSPPLSYAKPLKIRPNVRFKACVKSRCRRRMKNDRNPTWLRQTPSAIVSPRFAFSDRGAPGDFNVGFRFPGPIWPCVISPSYAVKTVSVPRRPSRPSRVLRQPPGPIIPLMGPPAHPLGALWECCRAACPHG